MLDNLLITLYDVAKLLLPIAGVVVLIALAILIFKIIKVVNTIPVTMGKVNDTIDTAQASIQKLEAPLETIVGISNTVDVINKSATGVVSSIASYTMQNSDAIMGWAKGIFKKSDNKETEETELKEEDFGIYE